MDAVEVQLYSKEIDRLLRGAAGVGATASATLKTTGQIKSVVIKTSGAGYSLGDILTVDGGIDGKFVVTRVTSTGKIKDVVKISSGSEYTNTVGATTTVTPIGGSGCTLTTIVEFEIDTITIDTGGTNYVTAVVKFDGGGNVNWSYGSATIKLRVCY